MMFPGIGPQTALKLVRKHGTIEHIMENLNKDRYVGFHNSLSLYLVVLIHCHLTITYPTRYQIPDSWPFQEVRMLFKDPVVTSPERQPELKWVSPDTEVKILSSFEFQGGNVSFSQ